MSSGSVAMLGIKGGADGLQREEQAHPSAGCEEEGPAANTVDHEAREDGPGKIPDLENTVDHELDGRIRDADRVEDFVEVVRYQTVAGPLGEESEGDDDPEAAAITRGREDGLPANVGSDCPIEIDRSFDFLVLVGDERICLVTIGVIISKGLQGLSVPPFGNKPSRGFWCKPDKADLCNGGESLKS